MRPSYWAWSMALGLCGCAVFASKSDYRDYRALRLARDSDQRVLLMQRYVASHPDGAWHSAIERQRSQSERAIFERHKSNREGLEFYLRAYPSGLFAEQARERLSAVSAIEQRKQDELSRAAQFEAQRKAREAELSRTWLTRFIGYWTKTLLGLRDWGAGIEQVARSNPDFSRAFGRPPRPRCSSDECVKYYDSAFAIPVPGGTRIERSLRLILRLRLEQGRLMRAELLIPDHGFSRWSEIEERRPVVDSDAEARKRALSFTRTRLASLLDELAPNRHAIARFTLAPIAAPQIAASGESVDTTVEDPSAPSNSIQGDVASNANPEFHELVKPAAPEQTPDLVMTPLEVGRDGRAHVQEQAPEPARSGNSTEPARPAPEPTEPAADTDPGFTEAFAANGLRLIVFAAPSQAPAPAYDAIVLERTELPVHSETSTRP